MAEVVGVCESTIRKWIREGKLDRNATREDLERLVEQRRQDREEREEAARVHEAAKILGIDRRTVIRWRAIGQLPLDATREFLEELAAQRRREEEARRRGETPVRLSLHAQRQQEAKAARLAEIEEQVQAGVLKVRKLTRRDLKRLEQGRARRLLPYETDRQAAA